MAFRYDPELEAILASVAQALAAAGSSGERGWKEVREESELGLAMLNDMSPPVAGVSTADDEVVRDDGARARCGGTCLTGPTARARSCTSTAEG